MSENDNPDLEALREEASTGNRLEADDPTAQSDFVDALVATLNSIEDGDSSETVTAYDPRLAATLEALEDDGQLEDVFNHGDAGLDTASRSAIIRLAVRVGLQEGADGVMDDLREAVERRQTTTV
jgi:hypothetical protein